jgi:hypothetical protein
LMLSLFFSFSLPISNEFFGISCVTIDFFSHQNDEHQMTTEALIFKQKEGMPSSSSLTLFGFRIFSASNSSALDADVEQ